MKPATITPAILGAAIIATAAEFIGLREVKPNAAWDNPKTPAVETALSLKLRAMMKPSPWEEGWAYCAAFAEGAARVSLQSLGLNPARFAALMSPHVMTSVRAFRQAGLLSDKPEIGSIWLAQHGVTDSGHAGILTAAEAAVIPNNIRLSTIEGNTSLDPSNDQKEREGDWITTRIFPATGRGMLRTRGFITPAAILTLCA